MSSKDLLCAPRIGYPDSANRVSGSHEPDIRFEQPGYSNTKGWTSDHDTPDSAPQQLG